MQMKVREIVLFDSCTKYVVVFSAFHPLWLEIAADQCTRSNHILQTAIIILRCKSSFNITIKARMGRVSLGGGGEVIL